MIGFIIGLAGAAVIGLLSALVLIPAVIRFLEGMTP